MIYVEIKKDNEIGMVHYMPFDEKDGLKKTAEELRKTGILVDSLPVEKAIDGKQAILKYDGVNLFYEYIDRPLTPEEEITALKAENEELKTRVAAMDSAVFAIVMQLAIMPKE